jgi:O-antigen ligase
MWEGLLAMAHNPVIGVGYESFWLGDRLNVLWEAYGKFIQSHNGYLETYLNLGLIGLTLVIAKMLSGLLKVRKQLDVDYAFAILRLTFIVIVAIYNWTEASFYSINNMWLLLFFSILDTSDQYVGERLYLGQANTQSVYSK